MDDIADPDWAGKGIGESIRDAARRKGVSYVKLSERTRELHAPIHRVALGKIERGERDVTVRELVTIAAALGTSPLALLLPNVLETVEPLPDKPMTGVSALGWLIGAVTPLGLRSLYAYKPVGVETDTEMVVPLQLLEIDQALAQRRHSLIQAERGAEFATSDPVRQNALEEAKRTKEFIATLEREYQRLAERYSDRSFDE